jgi:hypothetical protein
MTHYQISSKVIYLEKWCYIWVDGWKTSLVEEWTDRFVKVTRCWNHFEKEAQRMSIYFNKFLLWGKTLSLTVPEPKTWTSVHTRSEYVTKDHVSNVGYWF